MSTFEVRDMRRKEKFFVDDEYLNGYAKLCGANATLVYLCLCRHADRHQESFPSVETMAEKTGVSRDSVMRGLKQLIEWNIISKQRERRKDAKWLNNRYILLDKSVWKEKPSSTQQHGKAKSQIEPSQVANEGVSQVAVSDTKDTHKKDTHTKDTHLATQSVANTTIELFKEVNPTYERLYSNTTQRKAAERLVSKFGMEKVTLMVAACKAAMSDRYAPKITTPFALEKDMAKLIAWYNNQKQSKSSVTFV